MRYADDRRFQNLRHVVDQFLDLLRIDVEAARDDEILGTADQMHIAVGIDHCDVACPEPAAICKLGRRFFGHPPIAGEDVGATHLETANLAGCARHAFLVRHAQLDIR